MLEFIVLGHIPGTNIYLSFDLLAFTLAFIGTSAYLYMRWRKIKKLAQDQISGTTLSA